MHERALTNQSQLHLQTQMTASPCFLRIALGLLQVMYSHNGHLLLHRSSKLTLCTELYIDCIANSNKAPKALKEKMAGLWS